MTKQIMSLKGIQSAELILRNVEFKSLINIAYFPPIVFFKIITMQLLI